jgi:hypothetical protein
LFVGCPSDKADDAKPYGDAPINTDTHGHHHDHHHEGPHGGHVIELTDDHSVHLEVTFNKDDRSITLYVLGEDLKTPIPVKVDEIQFELDAEDGSEIDLALTPQPLDGESEGTSSVFVVSGELVPATIDDIEKLHGHVHITVDGKELFGELDHDHDHDDHDHDHDKAEAKDDNKADDETPQED